MIKPTIGRQVWFFAMASALAEQQPEAATVCYVHGDSLVNLQVIDKFGVARAELEVSLRQPEDPPWKTTPFAEWMPFQVGQAKTQQADEARRAKLPPELRPDTSAVDQARASDDGMPPAKLPAVAPPMTEAEHVAAGHQYRAEYDEWFVR